MAILVVAIRTMKTATSPLEEISTLDDYEMSVLVEFYHPDRYQKCLSPSSDEVANSMYGGQEKFSTSPSSNPPGRGKR